MNISILNALWSILVGEKLELEDPKLAHIIELFDELLKVNDGTSLSLIPLLPHPSMAKWPCLRKITGIDQLFKTCAAMTDFIEPYINEHQRTLDADNIRDFVDLMLLEIQNTTNLDSSFFGKTGEIISPKYNVLCFKLKSYNFPDVQEKVHKELDEVNNKKINMCDLILKVDRRMQNIIQTSKS